jgi:hypothetical protein
LRQSEPYGPSFKDKWYHIACADAPVCTVTKTDECAPRGHEFVHCEYLRCFEVIHIPCEKNIAGAYREVQANDKIYHFYFCDKHRSAVDEKKLRDILHSRDLRINRISKGRDIVPKALLPPQPITTSRHQDNDIIMTSANHNTNGANHIDTSSMKAESNAAGSVTGSSPHTGNMSKSSTATRNVRKARPKNTACAECRARRRKCIHDLESASAPQVDSSTATLTPTPTATAAPSATQASNESNNTLLDRNNNSIESQVAHEIHSDSIANHAGEAQLMKVGAAIDDVLQHTDNRNNGNESHDNDLDSMEASQPDQKQEQEEHEPQRQNDSSDNIMDITNADAGDEHDTAGNSSQVDQYFVSNDKSDDRPPHPPTESSIQENETETENAKRHHLNGNMNHSAIPQPVELNGLLPAQDD